MRTLKHSPISPMSLEEFFFLQGYGEMPYIEKPVPFDPDWNYTPTIGSTLTRTEPRLGTTEPSYDPDHALAWLVVPCVFWLVVAVVVVMELR